MAIKLENKYDAVIKALKDQGITTVQYADGKGTYGIRVRKGDAVFVLAFTTNAWRVLDPRVRTNNGMQLASRSASATTIAARTADRLDRIRDHKRKARTIGRRRSYTVAEPVPHRPGTPAYVPQYRKYMKNA